MGKPTGFMEFARQDRRYKPVADRVNHYQEFVIPLSDMDVGTQGGRCMDCGIPYCHNGCPVNNLIPDWNDLVYHQDWRSAIEVLHSTNNFPEFTGRICPAPCEAACTLNLDDAPVTIKTIECSIIDKAWDEGWIQPQVPAQRTGKRVAVVGSGPAGLACAQQLARAGHEVTYYPGETNFRAADLLVINHHLLLADMTLKQDGFADLLPGAEVFIVDEAHQLHEVASRFFGRSVSSRQLIGLAKDTVAEQVNDAPDMGEIREYADALENCARDFRLSLGEAGQRQAEEQAHGERRKLGSSHHDRSSFVGRPIPRCSTAGGSIPASRKAASARSVTSVSKAFSWRTSST